MPGLEAFEGRWTVTRTIDDHRAGGVATFRGTAEFLRDAEGLVYAETGVLEMPGAPPMTAERRYLWRPDGEGGIDVFFADGRPFHAFAAEGRPRAGHDCAPDTYLVAYDFTDWPLWRSEWTVTGPRKDYRMVTDYRR